MARPRVPLTYGAGLNRGTGTGAKDPRSFYDARNVIAREAGMELRTGLTGTGLPALDWGTDVLAMESVQKTLDVLQVVYDRPSRDVRVYRLNPVNTPTRQLVATWGTLNAQAAFPIITMAEAGGTIFMAHAEETLAYRLPTKYWTPGALDTDAGTLTTATADFDGSGSPGDIYFFGVCAYREYIVGWGWGTETDNTTKDRPEIVRLSKPDNPTVFPPESYFLCGTRSTRVVGCTPMPGGLLVGSRTQRYTIFGTDPETFGVELTDPSHGIVSPRAWRTINGVAYTWSVTGPRETTDPMAPSRDLAIPLDLMEAVPDGWVERGPLREAFAAYDPEQRVLYWVWPDLTASGVTRTMSYACSLRSPSEPRFSVAVFERRLACAGTYLSGKVAPAPGTGYASSVVLTDGGWNVGEDGRRLTVAWTNNNILGSEVVEVWLKYGGNWYLQTSVAVTGSSQSTLLTGLDALQDYTVALRHLAPGPTYTAGYTGATPDAWSAGTAAGSKQTITTGGNAPTLTAGTWARSSATVTTFTLTIQVIDTRTQVELQKDIGGGFVTFATIAFGGSTTLVQPFAADPAEAGLTVSYRARLVRGAATSAWSATRTIFHGVTDTPPAIDLWLDVSPSGGNQTLELWYTGGAMSAYRGTSRVLQFQRTDTSEILENVLPSRFKTSSQIVRSVGTTTQSFSIRSRVGVIVDGVTDYGPWSSTTAVSVQTSGFSTPAVPTSSRFTTPNGDHLVSYPSGTVRAFPRNFTPNQLTGNVRLLMAYESRNPSSGAIGSGWAQFAPAVNNTLVSWGLSTLAYELIHAIHYDSSTRRKSAATVLY